ncbi:unnamed protein product [Moneuplotes crassus]|uniref:Uncharacterized protein n=1 Tax=Euplotes crassus TaxID=5936 RepID=A0AAD1US89_EUPCR|nr:unnamed protein product [Moneuplotes crassus]
MSFLNRTFLCDSRRRTLHKFMRGNLNKSSIPRTSQDIFRPSNWSQARKEMSENNFYLCREYYDQEKDKKYSDWLNSKQRFMGIPFIASRKKTKDSVPRCKDPGELALQQYVNNKNNYSTFDNQKDLKRSQILSNFKQITRVITKSYMKSKPHKYKDSKKCDPKIEQKKEEENKSIFKMNKILRELLVKDTVTKTKAYPTFKYVDPEDLKQREYI